MKKSSIFMIGYVAFLFISPFVCIIFRSDMLIKISLAATIAGYFFALADIDFFLADQWTKELPHHEKELSLQQKCLSDSQKTLERLIQIIDNAVKIEARDKKQTELAKGEKINRYAQMRKDTEEHLAKIKKLQNRKQRNGKEENYIEKSINTEIILGNLLLVIGFLAFLLTIMFPVIAQYFLSKQSVYTIYGFGLIMLLYILRENADFYIAKKLKKHTSNVDYLVRQIRKFDKLSKEMKSLEKSFMKM